MKISVRWVLVSLALPALGCGHGGPNPVGWMVEDLRDQKRSDREAELTRNEDQYRDRAIALTHNAVTAANRGDCYEVSAIEQQILALPPPRSDPDALHDLFVREPALRACLHRQQCATVSAWITSHPELADDPAVIERRRLACDQ